MQSSVVLLGMYLLVIVILVNNRPRAYVLDKWVCGARA